MAKNPESPRYKWIVLSITTIGVLMVSIDATVVILAFPNMMAELHSDLVSMTWVLLAYILASTVLLLALGRVADLYGRVRLYNLGFAVFTVGSAFCGLSQTDVQLIASRVFQGVGGALMLVNSWALLTETFPANQRGMAMGINSMTFGLGSILGPLLGGAILAVADWRWVFLINIPIGTAGTIASYLTLHSTSTTQCKERLDAVGTLAFSVGLLALLLGLTQGISLGWVSSPILVLFAVAIANFFFFVRWERRIESPALDLSLFSNREFDLAVIAAMLQTLAIFAVQFLIVFYFQAVRDYAPLTAAILLLPMPILQAISGPLSGRLSDRVGARIPATIGLLVQATGVFILSTLTVQGSYLKLATGLGLTGLGGGMFYSPNTSAAMGTAPRERLGVAAATLATMRNVGMVTGFALTLAVAAASLPEDLMLRLFTGTSAVLTPELKAAFVEGVSTALHGSAAICVLAAVASSIRNPPTQRA